MPRVLAVTCSLGSKWESYSQALLATLVPEWERLVVDGRQGWTPTGFIEHVADHPVDYVVHIDEDCFVASRSALLELIDLLERDPSIAAAGLPDGGFYYRSHNAAALNLFFVAFRAPALRAAWSLKDTWERYRFCKGFEAEVVRQIPELDAARITWDEFEPYYPLFWCLLSGGDRFLYLRQRMNRRRWSTELLLPDGAPLAEHLWYLRRWRSRRPMEGHDCSNRSRYRSLRNALIAKHWQNIGFWSVFAAETNLRWRRKICGKRVKAGVRARRLHHPLRNETRSI